MKGQSLRVQNLTPKLGQPRQRVLVAAARNNVPQTMIAVAPRVEQGIRLVEA